MLTREITNKINWCLDNLVPPIIRDNKFVSFCMMYILFRKNTKLFLQFKEETPFMNFERYSWYYEQLKETHIQRESDLTKKIINKILGNIAHVENIVDIGCGDGYLSTLIKKQFPHSNIIGIDIIPPKLNNGVNYIQSDITNISLASNSMDTVICTHVLEHVLNIDKVLDELRRITKKRLIIVVPKQREFIYTFDLHIHFFPYRYTFLNAIKPQSNYTLECIQNDWVYVENYD